MPPRTTTRLMALLLASVFSIGSAGFVRGATITVNNQNGPNTGFNDSRLPDPDSTAGGNNGTTLGQQRLIAFEFAADLWGSLLDSPVEIQVNARMDPLPCDATSAVLGAAGPTTVHRDFVGAPVANTWYPQALANALAGSDLDPANADIGAFFNSAIDITCSFPNVWYYGLDANTPANKIDFVSVVLHEITHGLGFLTLVNPVLGTKFLGLNDVYMLNLENHRSGRLYPAMNGLERFFSNREARNLHWVGPHVVTASGFLTDGRHPSGHVEMYAPGQVDQGSSLSHFSNDLTPNELMEPFYTGPTHDVGLALELFQDLGWGP